jgi:hypothetical protein
MKKVYKQFTALILLLHICYSCTDVVDVSVPDGGERLVIEASILWVKGTTGQSQSIKLSTSTAYFSSSPIQPATGALVTVINNDTGESFAFSDQNDGNYTINTFVPILNNSYTLQITYNGKNYSATETLIPVAAITNIEQADVNGFDGDEIQVKIFFDDPAGIGNYYLGEFLPSHKPLLNLYPLKDEFSDGNENFMDYDDEDIASGDMIEISLHGISERFYNYISLLESQSGDDGPFSTTPAQLTGNCINVNDPNEEVLGYFRLGETDKTTYTIN